MTKRKYEPELKAEIKAILEARAKAEAEQTEAQLEATRDIEEVLGRNVLVHNTVII